MNNQSYIAIVTGASSGIGQQIALRLSSAGYFLLLVGRNHENLKTTQKLIEEQNPSLGVNQSYCLGLDVTSESAPLQIQSALRSSFLTNKKLKVLVNNAAIFHRVSFQETTTEIWKKEFDTNLLAPARLIHQLIPEFVEGSCIVNITSTLGERPIGQASAYSAVKAGLNNLTRCLAIELAPRIRVVAVAPGLTDTPIHGFHKDPAHSEQRLHAHSAQPMKRMGTPTDIAEMVHFLVSENSSWNTGSINTVDGGISLV